MLDRLVRTGYGDATYDGLEGLIVSRKGWGEEGGRSPEDVEQLGNGKRVTEKY